MLLRRTDRILYIFFINLCFQFFTDAAQGDWKETPPEREHNWFNVTDLKFGEKYEFTVIALNQRDDRATSKPEYVIVGYAAGLITIFLMHFGSQP